MERRIENSRYWLMMGLLLLGAIPTSGQCATAGDVAVQVIDNKLSVKAKDIKQSDLLKQITAKTGIRIHAELSLEQKINVGFEGLDADAALREILGSGANLFFRYPEGTATNRQALPQDVWVLNQGVSPDNKVQTHASQGSRFASGQNPSAMSPVDVKAMNGEEKAGMLEKLRSGDSEERVQAMARFFEDGKAGDTDVREALESARNDGDPQIRMMAMQTLASLPDGAQYLREALHDADAGVRRMALASLSPETEDGHLIREALRDPDQTVRVQAEEMIKALGL